MSLIVFSPFFVKQYMTFIKDQELETCPTIFNTKVYCFLFYSRIDPSISVLYSFCVVISIVVNFLLRLRALNSIQLKNIGLTVIPSQEQVISKMFLNSPIWNIRKKRKLQDYKSKLFMKIFGQIEIE